MGIASHASARHASWVLVASGAVLGTSDGSGVTCGLQLLMSSSSSRQHYQRACCCLLNLFIRLLAHISHTGMRHLSKLPPLDCVMTVKGFMKWPWAGLRVPLSGNGTLCVSVFVCVCLCLCVWLTHLALLVQRFYGECIGSNVNDRAQLEPIGGVGRPNWPPILHDSLLVGTTTRLVEVETETQTQWGQGGKKKNMQTENRSQITLCNFACKP